MRRTNLAWLLLFALALGTPAAAGEWEKGVKGDVKISVLSKSTAGVELHEWVKTLLPHWSKYTTLGPGQSWEGNVDGNVKFVVKDRPFISASDVKGGVDAHFEGVWIQLRHK